MALEIVFSGKRDADLADDRHASQSGIAAIIAGERALAHGVLGVGIEMGQSDTTSLRIVVGRLQPTAVSVADAAAVIPVEATEADRLAIQDQQFRQRHPGSDSIVELPA